MMKQTTFAALAAILLAGPLRAAEKDSGFMSFFKNLKANLEKSAVSAERKKGRGGSVAAVRGAGQTSSLADPNETVLRGDRASQQAKKAAVEDAEIEKAVDLILAGKTDDGIKALEAFKAKHPKSKNIAKVNEAIAQAKAASQPAAEPAKQ